MNIVEHGNITIVYDFIREQRQHEMQRALPYARNIHRNDKTTDLAEGSDCEQV